MTIEEFADVIQTDLLIRRYSNQQNRYTCCFERSEVKISGGLLGAHGNGKSVALAISDYIDQIRGQCLVIGAYSKERREFGVPESLTLA